MKKILFALFILVSVIACSEDDPIKEGDKPDIPEKEEPNSNKYQPGSVEYHFFVELGLKPSQVDSINSIKDFIENKDYMILLGKRNNQAWISKFSNNGDEIYDYELPSIDAWKYSHYNPFSIILNDGHYIFLKGWYSNVNTPEDYFSGFNSDEYISILDFNTGKELGKIGPYSLSEGESPMTEVYSSNMRYIIQLYERTHHKYNHFYVIGQKGEILYDRDWTKNEDVFFKNGIIFIDDNIIAPIVEKNSSFTSYTIANLKEWKLIKKIEESDGLKPQGDNRENNNVSYKTDTTYLKGDNIIFVYNEYIKEIKIDEITGVSINIENHMGKYYYEINTSTYIPIYKGRYEKQ